MGTVIANNPAPDAIRQAAAATPGTLAMVHTIESNSPWLPTRLHCYLDAIACKMAARDETRVFVSVPPQHGKTTHFGKYLPAWWIMRWPDEAAIYASYESDFAAESGEAARDIVKALGPDLFGVRVRPGVDARSRWAVDRWVGGARKWQPCAGGMRTAGAKGPITGKGASLLLFDDLIKNDEEALSKAVKDRKWNWYQATFRTRLRNFPRPGVIGGISTRWAEDDPPGRLRKASEDGTGEPWTFINLPAICEPTEAEPELLGREPGEALCPELHNEATLAPMQAMEYWWSALYQGRPTPLGGNIFKRHWFEIVELDDADKFTLDGGLIDPWQCFRFTTNDLAATEEGDTRSNDADFTVIGVWCLAPQGRLVLLDLVHERLGGHELAPAISSVWQRWRPDVMYVEANGMQKAIVRQLEAAGFPVQPVIADRAKIVRAMAAVPFCSNGLVVLRRAPWLDPFFDEVCSYPGAGHDDRVDVLSYACAKAQEWTETLMPSGMEGIFAEV
jgi:predicted phage terminase large subunit-like protein